MTAHIFLLFVIFSLELFSSLLDAIGYSKISSVLWETYSKLTGNKKAAERLTLKQEIVDLRKELRTVSSVDQFAKWAKMRRRLDALSSSFEQVSSDLAIERTAFELYVNLAIRFVVYGARAAINVWNYSIPVFYVPENWFYPVLWFLSLPAAPLGSVSVAVWSFVCSRVCKRSVVIFNRVYRPVQMENPSDEKPAGSSLPSSPIMPNSLPVGATL